MSNNTEAWYRKLFPTSHRIFLNKMIIEMATEVTGEVLVIGAGFGRYKALFKNAERVVNTDISLLPNIDYIADAHSLPFADNSFDTIIAFEVFEHLKDPKTASDEIFRVLRPQGSAYISIPFMFRVHADPDDYTRFTRHGLIKLFDKFKLVNIQAFGNSFHVVSDIITTRAKIFFFLRVFNHLFSFFGFKVKNNVTIQD